MRQILTLCAALLTSAAWCQLTYTNSPDRLAGNTSSGGCMGVTDMNGDGLDDIAILDGSDHVIIKYQNADGSFTSFDYGTISGEGQWGWAIADIDNDGHKDIVSGGGYDGTHYMRISAPGVFTLTDLNGPDIFTQCMSIADMNGDGRNDVFSCHDDGHPNIWFTDAAGVPQENNAYIDWATNCTGTSGDMSGNYGSTFTDFDNDGDIDLHISHCRQGVNDPLDCRRWDRLFVNDGTNHYNDQASAYGLQNHEQVWTSDFGDFDNDGDLDVVSTTHSATMELFENDGTGHFTDITSGSGLEVTGFFLQGLFRDFDNDGYLDVLTASTHFYFKGNGDGTFTQADNVFPASSEMHSFAIGDLNNDGFEDVFASYGSGYIDTNPGFPDRLWLATPNGNHWFRVTLQGTVSNRDAVGARVTIHGPFGVKIREVHAGESYGIVNSFALNFGLGAYDEITSVDIHWPSGLNETFTDVNVDGTIHVIEGTCISPTAEITTPGSAIVCGNGDAITLTANAGFNYSWSNGATTQSIDVSAAGNYQVTIDDGNGCEATTSIFVAQSPDETPTVSLSGDANFCEGDQLTITSSDATGYAWSNGSTDQSITVTTAGTYTVTVTGTCGDFTSDEVVVTTLDSPDAPVANDVTIPVAGTATLNATGENLEWYNAATGGLLMGTGSPFVTPFLWFPTTFWVAAGTVHGGGTSYGGQTDRINTGAPGQYHTNADNYEIFTASAPFTLSSVKVYANGAGNRTIAITDEGNGSTIATGVFNIPDGESRVDLNFSVPQGGPYGLRVVGGDPQLWRDGLNSNPAYPYALGTVGSITSSSVAGANATEYYYFFYDWEVDAVSTTCMGPRTPVNVLITVVGVEEVDPNSGVRVWPNPATDMLSITLGTVQGRVSVDMMDVTGRLVKSTNADASAQLNGTLQLPVGNLVPGEYVVRVKYDQGMSMHRIVVR
ncbi:MAG: FG-GAP-like repeat-containing protein [Flavobacteriales bacterium]